MCSIGLFVGHSLWGLTGRVASRVIWRSEPGSGWTVLDMTTLDECPISPAEIRAYRRSLGLKQAALAGLLGVDQATISRWERGLIPVEGEAWSRLQKLGDRHVWQKPWPIQVAEANTEGHWPALLKQFRLTRNLSQEQFAELSGHTTETISRWEGGRFTPSLGSQLKLRDLILKPLDSGDDLQRLFERVRGSSRRVSLHWGIFVVACSKPLRHTHVTNQYRISALSNLHEIHHGKLSPWMNELDSSSLLAGEAPLSHAHFRLSESDSRTIVCVSVPSDDVPGLSLSFHYPWTLQMDPSLDGDFRVLHADELIG